MTPAGQAFLAGPAVALASLCWAWWVGRRLLARPAGNEAMRAVASAIEEGAMAFLHRAYRTVTAFVLLLGGFLLVAALGGAGRLAPATAAAFVLGAVCSLTAGYAGMRVAVRANVRTAEAARHRLAPALRVAFDSGSVTGLVVAGLGLLGTAVVFVVFATPTNPSSLSVVNGFALGASSVALFARVAGGIFTKGADIGADLVGKLEEGIPEDDPRNPAVIADNVGDNVGDVAGMGADLFESYVGSLVAAVAIAATRPDLGAAAFALPFAVAAAGQAASVLASLAVRVSAGRDPAAALRQGTALAAALFLGGVYALTAHMGGVRIFLAVGCGSLVAVLLGLLSEHYTSSSRPATRSIAEAAQSGAAVSVITGLSVGMLSTAWPVAVMGGALLGAYELEGLYGVAMAAVGMLATTGMTLAVDAYGPVADNAGGIAEMAGLPSEVRERTDRLDAVGNTTAAIGKGVAVGSAALTALALFAAYAAEAHLTHVDLLSPRVIAGLLVGGMAPFLFAALAVRAVGRSAFQMVGEVRRQFRQIAGLREGTARPDYARCVDIATAAALREMIAPGALAVLLPLAAGLLLGREGAAGLLAGALAAGVALAIHMANSGGAMDNAKKYIEAGNLGGRGTPAHAAAVVGDTVGDPLKDTAGPALNILIKLMSIVALVFAPLFR
jgi:K(+)-stimulated pyrophosphate-energized sodium pump